MKKAIIVASLLVCAFIPLASVHPRPIAADPAPRKHVAERSSYGKLKAIRAASMRARAAAGQPPASPPPLRYMAHRGYSGFAPENTLPAFVAAFDQGADGIELDMQVSKDGQVVVMHDTTLDRTTNGKGLLREKMLTELRELDAGSWFHPKYAKTRIPTLQEVYDTVRPSGDQTVYAEIKSYRDPSDIAKMTAVVLDGGWENNTIMISFHYADFEQVRKRSRTIRIAYLCDSAETCRQAIAAAKADGRAKIFASYKLLLAEPGVAAEAQRSGLDMAAWTVNSIAVKHELERLGIRTFITDEPVKLREDRPTSG